MREISNVNVLHEKTDYGKVSVIMPCFNSEKYLKETIESVLKQTYGNFELIFVDDCSTDDSVRVVKSFGDGRIKIFSTEKNSGAAVARNNGIEHSSGRWLAFLDSDDIWYPEKLERQIAFMVKKGVAFSFTDYEVINGLGALRTVFKPKRDAYSYKDLLKHNSIGCLTVMLDTEKLGKIYMPVDAVKREDYAAWLSVLRTGEKAYCLHEVLAKYKIHGNSASSNKGKMIRYQWRVFRKIEKLNFIKSVYYLLCWAVFGVFKYR